MLETGRISTGGSSSRLNRVRHDSFQGLFAAHGKPWLYLMLIFIAWDFFMIDWLIYVFVCGHLGKQIVLSLSPSEGARRVSLLVHVARLSQNNSNSLASQLFTHSLHKTAWMSHPEPQQPRTLGLEQDSFSALEFHALDRNTSVHDLLY